MSGPETYNGWRNYETWAVKLWIDNEEETVNYWRQAAIDAWTDADADATFTHRERARFILADRLKAEHEEAVPELTGVWTDLLNAAMSEVGWDEIAESMIDGIAREVE